ncbi:MAG: hypothetical protein OXU36_00715 [Candidatus Poribacteria bacterium]|nr:hypothetical protein [Candidatus Poribacteria bacterium]
MKYPLNERISKIRDLINSSRKQHQLLQDSALWYMLCSCMDTIGDTEEALESFLKKDTNDSDKGRNYLHIYGALQALFVQQEAVANLHEALKIPYIEDSSLEKIRHIRIDAAGHPTKRGNKKAFNFITRLTLSAQEFHLMTLYPTKPGGKELNSKHIDISVPDLITTQKKVFKDVLNNVIETLKEEEVDHRKKFADKKLTDAFQHTTYPFTKIFEAILSTDSPHAQLVGGYIDEILKSIEAFKAGLRERDEPDDNIDDIYKNLGYALQNIKAYFHASQGTHIHREDTYIFADFAQRQVEILEEIAQEIDERYNDV